MLNNIMNIDVDLDTLRMALVALECKQSETFTHSLRTGNISAAIASRLHSLFLEPHQVREAALLHDIGKLYIPSEILNKPEALTAREEENIEHHPLWGEQILLAMSDKTIRNYAVFVRQHHERPDGSGYPYKLTLDEIAMESRVINIADRYCAMTEHRPYRKACVPEFVINRLRGDIEAFFGREASKVIDALAKFEHLSLQQSPQKEVIPYELAGLAAA